MPDTNLGLRLYPSDFDDYLLEMTAAGGYTIQNVQDLLKCRELLFGQLAVIPQAFEGYVGCVLDGTLYYSNNQQEIIGLLLDASAPGRLAYYHYVHALV